jgi:REP element-mobilizing transposase RayT
MADQLFHVIWTSFETYPLWDKNGDYQKTKELYSKLGDQKTTFHLSKEFPNYLGKKPKVNRVTFSKEAMKQLKTAIENLCLPGKDRIIDGMKLELVSIHENHVELLLRCDLTFLSQKISRLKSRTATLLSFSFPESHFGKNTWGKGFWFASILNHEEKALSIIKETNSGVYNTPLQ